jgi:hypothetical protein
MFCMQILPQTVCLTRCFRSVFLLLCRSIPPAEPHPSWHRHSIPDIHPGLSGPLLLPARAWNSYSLSIPADATLKYLYDVGRMDAAYWAVGSGLGSPQQAIEALSDTVIAN